MFGIGDPKDFSEWSCAS